MTEPKTAVDPSWLAEVKEISAAVTAAVKNLATLPDDPYLARQRVVDAKNKLERTTIGKTPIERALQKLNDQCSLARAEFWDRFGRACEQHKWCLDGTTSRRLLCHGIFVELADEKILVKELSLSFSPHVPSAISILEPEVNLLVPQKFNLEEFGELLLRAYENVPGKTERPVEAVYRAAVMLSQKPAFWNTQKNSSFTKLTRPAFRARLTALLTSDAEHHGRRLHFGTTTDPAGMWEIFSPGENRCVQVGRLYFS